MGNLFARLYDDVMEPFERSGFRDIRKDLVHKADGIVLEIGSGTGLNFPYYDNEQVRKLFAIEPNTIMLKQSLFRAKQSSVPIEVILAGAEEVPFPDNYFDTIVVTLVLCTIPYPVKALEEIRRVCKPSGKILICEHVRLDYPILGYLQDMLTPLWKHVADGCHLNRDTVKLIKDVGFEIVDIERYYKSIFLAIEIRNNKN